MTILQSSLITGPRAPVLPAGDPAFVTLLTSLNTVTLVAADTFELIQVPNHVTLRMMWIESIDGDAVADLDMDIILQHDAAVDAVLLNGGALFQAALKDFFFLDDLPVVANDAGIGTITVLVNTAAATGEADMTFRFGLMYH